MKKTFYLAILMLFSCKTLKKDDSTIYILPDSVVELLKQKINGNYENLYFNLSRQEKNYCIYYSYLAKNDKINHWLNNTNRKLMVEGKLYPLIFDYDEIYGITDSYSEILKDIKNNNYPSYSKTNVLYDGEIIIFNRKGEIFNK